MFTLSVVIPTHNRHAILEQVLQHLADGSVKPDEVIVVDDGSTPAVTEKVNIDAYGFTQISVIRHEKGRGAATARNEGARAASSDVIVFIDDDVFPDTHCLRYHQLIHQQHPDPSYGIMGRIYFDPDLPRTPLMHFLEEQGNFSAVSKGEDRFAERRGLISANFSLKRSFLSDKETLFNETFPFSQTEDTEFGVRMVTQGWDLHFHVAPSARHHSPFTLESYFEKTWQGGVSKAYWALEYPEDTYFVTNLNQVIRRKAKEQEFREISDAYMNILGEAVNSDMSAWDSLTYQHFQVWMLNASEWWRNFGMYDGWLRIVPAFQQIADTIEKAFDAKDLNERLALLNQAWQYDTSFLPSVLLLSDELAKVQDYEGAIVPLLEVEESLPVLERLMRYSARQGKKDESMVFAQRMHDRASTPKHTHQRYRQRATQHITKICPRGKLDPAWAEQAWGGLRKKKLREMDLPLHDRWFSWLSNEVKSGGEVPEHPTLDPLMNKYNEAKKVESELRDLCDGYVDFVEKDNTRTFIAPEPSRASKSQELGITQGVVTWYNQERGFGYIKDQKNDNLLFLHKSNLRDSAMVIEPGLLVEYTPNDTALGLEALDISNLPE